MFRRKTVFVIGAGASAPAGFPTGRQLLSQARLRSPNEMHQFTQGAIALDQAEQLSNTLRMTLVSSIDVMLEHRQDLWPAGKRLISALLINQETRFRATIQDVPEDWLSWIFERMSDGCIGLDAFGANPVSFVTFNYDRLLEYRLVNGLAARYQSTSLRASEVLKHLPVIHLHGSIGPIFHAQEPSAQELIPFGGDDAGVAFGRAMNGAEQNIQVVYEAVPESPAFKRARKLLQSADQVVFLGFGFAQSNVDRLALDHLPNTTDIYCSTYGMSLAEIDHYICKAVTQLPRGRIHEGVTNESLLAFLLNHVSMAY